MRYITSDDIVETCVKIRQRGMDFFFSKFTPDQKERTRSAFNTETINTSNWWDIPLVRQRWNRMITGNPGENYRQYLVRKYLKDKSGLRLLSLGSGSCSQEIELAQYPQFSEVVCVDIAENRLEEARNLADKLQLKTMKFLARDVYSLELPEKEFDILLFNSSLHHFSNIENLLVTKVIPWLKEDGFLVINEYVGPNRLQFPKEQINAINAAVRSIDRKYRKRYRTRIVKSGYSGPGLWRMILADPSECVESEMILPLIHQYFEVIEERPVGGNILMGTLKDLAYQFVDPGPEQQRVIERLFSLEDDYLRSHVSDYMFGIYKPKATN